MKIFICSHKRPHMPTLTQPAMQGAPVTVLLHDEEQYGIYRKQHPGTQLVLTREPAGQDGKMRQLEFLSRRAHQLMPGEWVCICDDNVLRFECLPDPWWHEYEEVPVQPEKESVREWRARFTTEVPSWAELEKRLVECTVQADSIGARLVGFAVTDNPVHRTRKWRPVGYAKGKVTLWKHDPAYPWERCRGVSMEDYWNTGMHLELYGRVLVCNWLYPKAKHYQPGGMGTRDQRLPARLRDVARFEHEFPGLVRVKPNSDGYPDLSLRFHSGNVPKLEQWRREQQARVAVGIPPFEYTPPPPVVQALPLVPVLHQDGTRVKDISQVVEPEEPAPKRTPKPAVPAVPEVDRSRFFAGFNPRRSKWKR